MRTIHCPKEFNLSPMYWILFERRGFKISKFYKECVSLLAPLPPRNFSVFESQSLLEYYTPKSQNFHQLPSFTSSINVCSYWPIDSRSFLPETHLLDILEIFSLDMGQISINIPKKAFATWQHGFLPTSIAFYDNFVRACAEINFFFAFPISPLLILLLKWFTFSWAWFQLKTFWESIIETGNFYHGVATYSRKKFCSAFFTLSFSLWSGYHWKDLFLLQNLSIDNANFGQR